MGGEGRAGKAQYQKGEKIRREKRGIFILKNNGEESTFKSTTRKFESEREERDKSRNPRDTSTEIYVCF